jgi:4-diphosphocytidyl-2-C-methyl-D-erythritol kinase
MAVTLHAEAPGKVNLCLYLGGTREDGRHRLVTVFESVTLADALTLTELSAGADEVICEGVEGPNLVGDALAGLRALGWDAPPVRVEIEKRVPVAAGMGGGSGDAAAMLRLARFYGGISEGDMWELAARLGADVPSQVIPGVSLGTGAGEVVEQAAPPAEHALVIVPLPAALSTPAVFREADRLALPRDDDDLSLRLLEVSGWLRRGARLPARLLVNDLEPAARSLCPLIDDALAALREAGAETAFVCGSGPTCAGLWWGSDAPGTAERTAAALRTRFSRCVAVAPATPESGRVTRG